jgi:hypothetical protein
VIVKTAYGYASTPTSLVNFNGTNGAFPYAGLIADAHGDLFGTTYQGGTNGVYGVGTVFEIAKTANGYASTPTTLVSFNGTDGAHPYAGLIADAHGDLFGTTVEGGAYPLASIPSCQQRQPPLRRQTSRSSGRRTLIIFPTAPPQVLLQSSDCGRDSIRVMALHGP